MNSSRARLITIVVGSCLLFGTDAAHGQVFPHQIELSSSVHVDALDTTATAHLERVKAFVADQQWDEAVETLRQVMENSSGKLVQLLPHRYVNAADYCHLQISALPSPALDLYRQRVDPLAQKWYEEGQAKRDDSKLLAVVEQFFCSSSGDEALLVLGDIALEQGQPGLARRYWQRIVERPLEQVPVALFEAALMRDGVTAEDSESIRSWYTKNDEAQSYRLRHDQHLTDDSAASIVRFWKAVRVPQTVLAYPATSLDLAQIRARLVLASIMESSVEQARSELDGLEQLHAAATGSLAGRDGKYVETLRLLFESSKKWPSRRSASRWTTFAGEPTRNGVAAALGSVGAAAWPAIVLGEPLAADVSGARELNARRVAEDIQALTSYHPIIYQNLLLTNNERQIFAFDLTTGKPAWPSSDTFKKPGEIFSDDGPPLPSSRINRALGVPRFTMTAHAGRLYACMGLQVTSRPVDALDPRGNYLVCLDLAADGRLVWPPKRPDDDRWAFEGAPLIVGSDLYIAMRRNDVRPQVHAACYDVETGERRWRTFVCSAETPSGGQTDEMTHNLLTYDQGSLYLNTNLGAIASLAARDGQIQWLTLYQRAKRSSNDGQEKRPAHYFRDLNPCIYASGMLAAAPSDSEYLMGLDANTGQILWQNRTPEDVVHLLGIADGNLIAAGDHVWWVKLHDGSIVHRWPDTTPLGFGRGVLAGSEVLWPTREAIYGLKTSPGADSAKISTREPIRLAPTVGATGGNLLVTPDRLLITTPDKIYGFQQTPPSR